jgi:hypothetical protein
MSEGRSPRWRTNLWAATAAASIIASPTLAQTRTFPVVSAVEQAHRDIDRLHILRSELSSEEASVQAATRRRAERLVARDEQGVREAEQAYVQHLANIAALRREIDAATGIRRVGSRERGESERKAAASSNATSPAPVGDKSPEHAPWWDVYQRRNASRPANDTIGTEVDKAVHKDPDAPRRGVVTPMPFSVYREGK